MSSILCNLGRAKKLPVPWHWWTGQFGAIIYILQYLIEFRICSSKAQAGTLLAKGQSQKLTIKLGILFCTLNKWLAKYIYLLLLLLLILTAKTFSSTFVQHLICKNIICNEWTLLQKAGFFQIKCVFGLRRYLLSIYYIQLCQFWFWIAFNSDFIIQFFCYDNSITSYLGFRTWVKWTWLN